MSKTLQIRIDDSLRLEAEEVLDRLGLDTPTAVRLFLKKVVQTRGIPFDLKVPDDEVAVIAVDAATQVRLDEIGEQWRHKRVRGA